MKKLLYLFIGLVSIILTSCSNINVINYSCVVDVTYLNGERDTIEFSDIVKTPSDSVYLYLSSRYDTPSLETSGMLSDKGAIVCGVRCFKILSEKQFKINKND